MGKSFYLSLLLIILCVILRRAQNLDGYFNCVIKLCLIKVLLKKKLPLKKSLQSLLDNCLVSENINYSCQRSQSFFGLGVVYERGRMFWGARKVNFFSMWSALFLSVYHFTLITECPRFYKPTKDFTGTSLLPVRMQVFCIIQTPHLQYCVTWELTFNSGRERQFGLIWSLYRHLQFYPF